MRATEPLGLGPLLTLARAVASVIRRPPRAPRGLRPTAHTDAYGCRSLVTVFTSKDGTGLGTILGSAVFNLVMIVCLSGMFGKGPEHKLRFDKDGKEYLSSEACAGLRSIMVATKDSTDGKTHYKNPGLFLDWRPLFRDATFYVLSLIICVIFALTDVGDGWCDGCTNSDGKLIDSSPWCVAGAGGRERECAGYNNMPGFNWYAPARPQ